MVAIFFELARAPMLCETLTNKKRGLYLAHIVKHAKQTQLAHIIWHKDNTSQSPYLFHHECDPHQHHGHLIVF